MILFPHAARNARQQKHVGISIFDSQPILVDATQKVDPFLQAMILDEFAQLGRVSLMYRTLDGSETGYWDANQKTWVVDESYKEAVEEAIRVARRDGAADLLTVPVPAPQEVRS